MSGSDFLTGIDVINERNLSSDEQNLLKIMQGLAHDHGATTLLNFLTATPEEVRRRFALLRKEALKQGLEEVKVLSFMDYLLYLKRITTFQDVHGGFYNDILIAGNTITLRIQELLNAGQVQAQDAVKMNGIFGMQGILKRAKDLAHQNDIMPFLYAIHSAKSHSHPLPAYFLFFGETINLIAEPETKESNGSIFLEEISGPWFNANLVLERKAKFIDEGIQMSLDATQDGLILMDHRNERHFLPFVTAIYDSTNHTMWRVERVHGHIFAEKLDDWLRRNIDREVYPGLRMFGRREIVLKHIERLAEHALNSSESLTCRHHSIRKVGCVDGRQDNNKSEIGCLIGDRQLEYLVSDKSTSDVLLAFHTECGYINTAISLHRFFHALRMGIDPSDTLTLHRATIFLSTLTKMPWIGRDNALFAEFFSHVDLSKVTTDPKAQQALRYSIQNLFTDSQGSLRSATSHMLARHVFQMRDGFPVMTAAENVEKALQNHGIQISDSLLRLLVTEELVRLDRKQKSQWLLTNEKCMLEQRLLEPMPSVVWTIEDFVTGRYYEVPNTEILNQSADQILSSMRRDLYTGKEFDIVREG